MPGTVLCVVCMQAGLLVLMAQQLSPVTMQTDTICKAETVCFVLLFSPTSLLAILPQYTLPVETTISSAVLLAHFVQL